MTASRLTLALMTLALLLRAATITEEAKDGKTVYRLENERLSAVVDPAAGGTVMELRDRLGGDVNLIPSSGPRGIGIDHFQIQPWPGEMYNRPYTVTGTETAGKTVSVTLSYTATGEWNQVSEEQLKGLVLTKTWSLTEGSPALACKVTVAAPAKASKLFAYWQQSIFFAGGTYDRMGDISYRPSVRGVRAKVADGNGHTGLENMLRDFSAGWLGVIDSKAKSGLTMLTNYDELLSIYTSAGNFTSEFMYRRTFMPAGRSATYEVLYIPVVGLENLVTVNEDFAAGCAVTSDGAGKGTARFKLVRSQREPAPVTFEVRVASALTPDKEVAAGTITFAAPAAGPVEGRVDFSGAGADPLVVRVKATVAGDPARQYAFEEYVNGSWKWGENLKTDMVSPIYRGERPPQQVTLIKPDQLKLKREYNTQAWYVEGLMDDYYRVSEAIKITAHYLPEHTVRDFSVVSFSEVFGTRIDDFPWDYDRLLRYDFIVLGGVKEEAIGQVGLEMLTDFVNAGGGLLVLGGPSAYGASGFHGTAFAEQWPVVVPDNPFGLKRVDNAVLKPVGEVDFLEDLDWSAQPRVQWVHDVQIRPEGKVVLEAGGKPVLVVRELPGGARIACLLASPQGTFGKGETPFWEWRDWVLLMRQVNWWMENSDNNRLTPKVYTP